MKTMNLDFRQMLPEDAASVEIVEKACFNMPWSRESFWQEASNDKAFYLLATVQENSEDDKNDEDNKAKVIGYVGVWILFDEAQITNVAVLPEYRDKGVGREMMKQIIAVSRKRGAKAMTLEVRPSNARAIHLYESLGFKSVGRRRGYYEDNGEDAEIMWLTDLDI